MDDFNAAGAKEMPPAMTVGQYVILAESQRRKAALTAQQAKYHEVIAENRRLQEQHDAAQKENFEVTEYLRREILSKDEKNALLEVKIDDLHKKLAEEAAATKAALAEQATRLRAEAAQQNRDQWRELVDVKEQLQVVITFRTQQAKVQEEMEKLRSENTRLLNQHEDRVRQLQAEHAQAASRLRHDFNARLEEARRANDEDIDERLNAATKRVLTNNRSLQAELRVHVEESEDLSRDVKQLVADRQRLVRELELKAQMEQQYAKRSTLQAREVREANMKVEALERSLQQVLRDAEAERQVLLQRTAAQLAEAETESNSLRRLVRLKARELKSIRRLAHEVLLQRSDVETFLVSSLRQVRDEIMRERQAGRAAELKPLPGRGQQIDIKDLGWDDRERVLRLLFAKVNNQAQQAYYLHLPPHSFDGFNAQSLQGVSSKGREAQLA